MAETTENPRLLPRIKVLHPSGGTDDGAIEVTAAEAPLVIPLSADLGLALMIDRGEQYELIKQGFRDLNPALSDSDIINVAIAGLQAEVGSNIGLSGRPGHLMQATCGGNFEAALIIFPAIWAALHEQFPGDLIVGIPTPDVLIVANADKPDAVEELKAGVARVLANEQPSITSRTLYRKTPESADLQAA